MQEQNPVTGQDTATSDDFAAFEAARNKGETVVATPSETPAEKQESETAGDSETPGDKQESGDENKPKKGGFQRRIDKLTATTRTLEQENADLKRRLAGEPAARPAESKPAAAASDGKPALENFNTYDEYNEALVEWKLDQRETVKRQNEAKSAIEAEQKAVLDKWAERADEVRTVNDDYDDVMETAGSVKVTPAMESAILESEVGPLLAYHLAKNPSEAERIAKLSPVATVRELLALEAKLATPKKPAQPVKKTSSAPEPIKPVSKTGGKAPSLTDPNISFSAFEKLRNAR